MFTAGIRATYTWNHSYIYASGANSIYLLIEWDALERNSTSRKSKLFARNVELHLWLEPGITVVNTYGCQGNLEASESSLVLSLGHLYTDLKRCVVIECSFQPYSACKRPVISAQWRYKGVTGEKLKEQAVEDIYINYTYNLGNIQNKGAYEVEKQVKLLKTTSTLQEALQTLELGDLERAQYILNRKGDELLLFAVQTGDIRVMEEAEKLYRILKHFGDTYEMIYTKRSVKIDKVDESNRLVK